MSSWAMGKGYLYKVGVLVIAFASYLMVPGVQEFMATSASYLKKRDFEALRQFILAYGMWAPVTSIALMTMQSVIPVLPGIVITITNAWIFGWVWGAVYSWIGALLGATLDFGIARWYGRPVVERFIKSSLLDKTNVFFRRNGVLAVFIARMTPIVPFKVVSYGAGLTKMPLIRFVAATGLGQAPAIVLYSFLGRNLTRNFWLLATFTMMLACVGAVTYYFRTEIERYLLSLCDREPKQ